jgi:hypothetical protein
LVLSLVFPGEQADPWSLLLNDKRASFFRDISNLKGRICLGDRSNRGEAPFAIYDTLIALRVVIKPLESYLAPVDNDKKLRLDA